MTKEDAKKRMEFTAKWRDFDDWNKVIFSDESSIQCKPNNSVQFVFRFSNEKFRKDLVNLKNHGKDISQMVWGSIWLGGRSKLAIMERDENGLRGGLI